MRAIVATVLSLIATSLGLVVLVLVSVLTTETGLKFAVEQIHALAPNRFAVGAVDGRLIGPLTIHNLDLKTATSHLSAASVSFDWSPSRLFVGDVVINRLHVRDVIYEVETETTSSQEQAALTPTEVLALLQPPPTVELNDIALQNFEYRAPGSKPFVIHHAELAAGSDTNGLHLDKLQASGPLFAVEGQGIIKPQRGNPTEVALRWQVRLPDYPVAVGHTTLNGSLEELHVTQRIDSPYHTQATVVVNDALTEPHFQAEVHLNAIRLQAIRATLPNLTVNATTHAKGRAADIGYTVQAKIIDPAQGTFKLTLDGGLAQQVVDIRRLALAVVGTPTRLQANGRVDLRSKHSTLKANWQKLRWPLQGEPQFTSSHGDVTVTGTPDNLTARLDAGVGDEGGITGRMRRKQDNIQLALDWHDLNWPLQQPRVSSPQGAAQVTGTLEQYKLAVNARVDMPDQTGGHVILEGTGGNKSLDLARIDLKVLQGEINGNASVTWQPQIDGRINLTGNGINPGVLLPDWPGKLALRVRASGARQANKLTAQLTALELTGRLRGQDFALHSRADYREDELQLERLSLVSGSSTVQASGTVGPTLGINWRIDSDNLATLLPGAAGSLHGQGQANGTLQQPRIKATLDGKGVRYTQYEVNRLALRADVDMQGKTQSTIALRLQDGQAAGVKLSNINFTGQGTPRAHQFELAADTSSGDADLRLNGGLRESVWSFALTKASLKYPTLAAWTLAEPAQGRVSAELQELGRTCWASAEAKLCVRGQRSTEGLQTAFQLDGLPFNYFAAILPTNIALKGNLSGYGEVKQPHDGLLAADVRLNTTPGVILATDDESETRTPVLRFNPATIRADMGVRGLELHIDLPFVDQGGLQVSAEVPAGEAPLTDRPLNGQVHAQLRDIGFLAKLLPDVQQLGGRLQGRMQISGTLARPALLGRMALQNGSAQLPGPGLDIKELSAEIVGQRAGGLRYSVHAKSGGGTMHLAGTADLTGKTPTTEMRINGQDFQAFNTNDAKVFISPALQVSVNAAGITVNGEVRVPRAAITPKKIPPSAVTVSSDQVIVEPDQEGKPKIDQARELHVRVRLIVGQHVHFEGFGLKGRIEGALLIVQQPGKPTRGSGELRIMGGEYRAYGQGLVIETGRILFAGGPIDQPGADIRAVRHPAEDVTVGVQVRGTLKEPNLTIFSNPSMTQAEQLSWLVLGRPLEGASSSESSMLSQAALALGLKGGDFLAKQIGKNIGVDTIGIETGSSEAGAASNSREAALVIGKYLSPGLYVSYGIGLFDHISTVRLQYTLSSRWKIATESSTEASGGDVIYTIER